MNPETAQLISDLIGLIQKVRSLGLSVNEIGEELNAHADLPESDRFELQRMLTKQFAEGVAEDLGSLENQ